MHTFCDHQTPGRRDHTGRDSKNFKIEVENLGYKNTLETEQCRHFLWGSQPTVALSDRIRAIRIRTEWGVLLPSTPATVPWHPAPSFYSSSFSLLSPSLSLSLHLSTPSFSAYVSLSRHTGDEE